MNTREEWLGSALAIIRLHIRDTAAAIVPADNAPYCGICVVTDEDSHDCGMPIRMTVTVEEPDADNE